VDQFVSFVKRKEEGKDESCISSSFSFANGMIWLLAPTTKDFDQNLFLLSVALFLMR
jgi:hypothetical protein